MAAIYSVGLSEMAQLESEFERRRPEARLEVQYLQPEKVYAAVLADEADLGLVSYPEPTREIKVIPWRQEEMVLAASPDHPLAGREQVTPAESERRRLRRLRRGSSDPPRCGPLPARHGVEVNRAMHFDNLQMIKEAVAHRVGVSIMPARIHARGYGARTPGGDPHRRARAVPAAGDHPSQEKAVSPGGAGISGFAVREAGADGSGQLIRASGHCSLTVGISGEERTRRPLVLEAVRISKLPVSHRAALIKTEGTSRPSLNSHEIELRAQKTN